MRFLRTAFLLWLIWLPLPTPAAAPPAVELVDIYPGHLDLSHYWVSEKYNGARGYWDGHELWTRGGQKIAAPAWFTKNWPTVAMDGELWAGYGHFGQASAAVRAEHADDAAWRAITYRVFDLPGHGGAFDARVPAIRQTVAAIGDPWVIAIQQFRVADDTELHTALQRVLARGGEGLVLHRGDVPYRAGRGAGLYKLKPYLDAEARVVAIKPGHGRLQGVMGSLRVRRSDGREFSIGSGFTDAERAHPPRIGSWITYRYTSLTATGLPRFARFLRERPGGPPPEVRTPAATRVTDTGN
ncbi:MAG TPA: DNA ligase [Nevskiaceae bacterium]|nr:DNA ligase [Nevskiaceae bacterium]